MKRTTVIALVCATLMAACTDQIGVAPVQPAMDPTFSNSIGFTGLGRERF